VHPRPAEPVSWPHCPGEGPLDEAASVIDAVSIVDARPASEAPLLISKTKI
jgi:hypothetical protein